MANGWQNIIYSCQNIVFIAWRLPACFTRRLKKTISLHINTGNSYPVLFIVYIFAL
jgi:hypothetical protein